MSAVGFAPLSSGDSEPELDQLREACKRLSFTLKAIKEAQASLSKLNMGQARDRLNNAQWQAQEAKKVLVQLGKAKKRKAR